MKNQWTEKIERFEAEIATKDALLAEAKDVCEFIISESDECKNCHAPLRQLHKKIAEAAK
jgi:hypothetical protein